MNKECGAFEKSLLGWQGLEYIKQQRHFDVHQSEKPHSLGIEKVTTALRVSANDQNPYRW
ncbi:MAG: hypothetical protein LC541_16225 [Candidatus Thiodiazotropha sp.]|nr:hypothetical protein [Candidatus Thiodiazotropha sp.]MCM8884820.1 hypothetical protein [Candidatus Thiodiazotropha sp.]MCM8919320.1 hypothetical protein [Candidatus Thiodiazotropha sp.]